VAAAALLIHAKAEVDIRSRTYDKSRLETPLMIAAKHGQVSMVCMLLDAGANVDLRCKNDDSALVYAVVSLCSAQDPRHQLLLQEVVVRLLEARVDVGLADKSCRTPVWHAAGSGRVDTLQLLVQARAPVNTRAGNLVSGDTPLMLAARRGHVRAVQYLLQAKAELTEPLTFSCQNLAGRRILQLLTSAKATV
jgi:ankyrin repeat protein